MCCGSRVRTGERTLGHLGDREIGSRRSESSSRPDALPLSRPAADALAERLAGLLAQCAVKNQRAFAELYTLTSAKLFGVSLRILRRQDWAEEVLQECYVSIWTHAGDYAATRSAPLTWMTSIVRNRCLDWLRRPQSETTGEEYEIAVESWQDEAAGPLEQLMAAGEAGALIALPRATGSRSSGRASCWPSSTACLIRSWRAT